MLEATLVFLASAGLLSFAAVLGYRKAAKLPENKGLEPMAILAKSFIRYSLTYFAFFQLCAMLGEAALLGSIQDKNINVTARMMIHVTIALIGFAGAFSMTKYFGALVHAFLKKKVDPWERIGLIAVNFALVVISTAITVGSPLFNLMAMANGLHQTTALEIWWTGFRVALGWLPQAALTYKLAINNLPPDYAPFASLHGGMVTSIGITTFHITVTIWEALIALMLSMTHKAIRQAVFADFFDYDPAEANTTTQGSAAGSGGSQANNNNSQQNNQQNSDVNAAKTVLEKLLVFYGIDPAKKDNWVNHLLPQYFSLDPAKAASNAANAMKAVGLETKINNARNAGQQQLRQEITDFLQTLVPVGMTLPRSTTRP